LLAHKVCASTEPNMIITLTDQALERKKINLESQKQFLQNCQDIEYYESGQIKSVKVNTECLMYNHTIKTSTEQEKRDVRDGITNSVDKIGNVLILLKVLGL